MGAAEAGGWTPSAFFRGRGMGQGMKTEGGTPERQVPEKRKRFFFFWCEDQEAGQVMQEAKGALVLCGPLSGGCQNRRWCQNYLGVLFTNIDSTLSGDSDVRH